MVELVEKNVLSVQPMVMMGKPLALPMCLPKPCGSPCSTTSAVAFTACALAATHLSMASVLPLAMAARFWSMDSIVLLRTMEYVAAPDSARAPITVADEMRRMRVRREEIMILLGGICPA